jgi:hypothetical protein
MISVPSPSPSMSFAKEGDMKMALYPCLKVRLQSDYTNGIDLNKYFALEQTFLQIFWIGSIPIIQVSWKGEISHNTAL